MHKRIYRWETGYFLPISADTLPLLEPKTDLLSTVLPPVIPGSPNPSPAHPGRRKGAELEAAT